MSFFGIFTQSDRQEIGRYGRKILFNWRIGNLLLNVHCPNFQRPEDEEHTNDIYSSLRDEKNPTLPGQISIALVEHPPYLILDGQHRLCALKKLSIEKPSILNTFIDVAMYECSSITECQELHKINFTKPVLLYAPGDEAIIINDTLRYIQKKYKSYIKKSDRPQVPNINIDTLAKQFKDKKIVERAELRDSDELISLVEELNSFYMQLTTERLSIEGECGVDKKKGEKDRDNPFYLGLFKNYEWIERMVIHKRDNLPYEIMGHYSIKEKSPQISDRIKSETLRRKGEDSKYCFCCGGEIEGKKCYNFVVPICFGGEIKTENVEITCEDCNKEVGIMNLNEYRELLQLRNNS